MNAPEAGLPLPLVFSVEEMAHPADLVTIDSGLEQYNSAVSALAQVRQLGVFARDEKGLIIGGAVGRTWGQCCELLQLWVREAERGCAVGSRLMSLFEAQAAARGCTLVYLSTFSFQAPGFDSRLGYQTVLETQGFTDGIVKSTMHKRLGRDAMAV